jgi:hypothetical protein
MARDELSVGFEQLLKKIDPFGVGLLPEELFPDAAEEEMLVGVNRKESEGGVYRLGSLTCVDIADIDQISIKSTFDYESPAERHRRLHEMDVQN